MSIHLEAVSKSPTLYDCDYNLWVIETVNKLKNRDFNALDLDNLIEEVADLSRRDKHKLKSLLRHLFEHLLKLAYWRAAIPENESHWKREVINFRKQIQDLLADSPSLKYYLKEILDGCYQDGRELASTRSQLPLNTFPEQPIADLKQVLDDNWFPPLL